MRLIRGLGALAVLLAAVVGAPVLLLAVGRELAADHASWSGMWQLLHRSDDGRVLAGLVLLVAWCGWLVCAASVLAELVGVLSGFRLQIRLPGLAAPQRLAAGLLVAVIAMLSTPSDSAAALPAEGGPAGVEAPAGPPGPAEAEQRAPRRVQQASEDGDQQMLVHTVQAGDDLWSLAERYYGTGRDWRKIARANPTRLSGGPDRLEVGWQLRIPDAGPISDAAPVERSTGTVVVREGDTLSAIAERVYDNPHRWPEIYAANRRQLDDPDELRIGMRLAVPAEAEDERVRDHRDRTPREPRSRKAESRRGTSQPVSPSPDPTPPPATPPSTTAQPADPADAGGPADSAGPAAEPTASAPAVAVAAGLATVGGLLAAGVIAGLADRRRLQLQARPVGRRILPPAPPAQAAEAVLGRRSRPASLRTLDVAVRAVGAACLAAGVDPPRLRYATVAEDEVVLHWAGPVPVPPAGFTAAGATWRLPSDQVPALRARPEVGDALRPYPALVTLGCAPDRQPVLVDLESLGLLAVNAEPPGVAEDVLLALAVELSFSPWADELVLTLVGPRHRLPEALGKHNVTATDDVDGLLSRLESRAAKQRARHDGEGAPRRRRLDPDLADPWAPEIVLVTQPLAAEQSRRLRAVLTEEPPVTMAAVVAGATGTPWTLRVRPPSPGATEPLAALEPDGLDLIPQRIAPAAAEAVVDLVEATGSERTVPAPWWHCPEPEPPPDNVTYLGRRFGGWVTTDRRAEEAEMDIDTAAAATAADAVHPILRLLGPVDLVGAAGDPPPRAAKSCLEYCGWLLEHPGSTAQAMAAALAVAEGTRRSNVSRLRSWLGVTPDGEPYLPDAYTGRIRLHPAVSSDWHRLQIFTAGGVNRSSTGALRAALDLVRGAPLADAAPGQWHWAEELRTDMISAVRDIGVELAERALADNDVDLARWAAARALVAAPGDELLMVARIRTEHQAGNRREVERLTLQVAAQARQLGVDLEPETIVVLQEVLEGRVRARLA